MDNLNSENVECRKVSVCIAEHADAESERRKLTRSKKKEFKRAASKALGVSVEAFSNCTFHHIVPVWWGGTSDFSNLILIRRSAHRNLHKTIDKQVAGAETGERLVVEIPFPVNPWVWDVRDYFDEYGNRYSANAKTCYGDNWLDQLREEYSIYAPKNRHKTPLPANNP